LSRNDEGWRYFTAITRPYLFEIVPLEQVPDWGNFHRSKNKGLGAKKTNRFNQYAPSQIPYDTMPPPASDPDLSDWFTNEFLAQYPGVR
jgi:hypothetical protein